MKYWVGRNIYGDLCVYDPSAQDRRILMLRIWNSKKRELQKVERDDFFGSCSTVRDRNTRQAAMVEYRSWIDEQERKYGIDETAQCWACYRGIAAKMNTTCRICDGLLCDHCRRCRCSSSATWEHDEEYEEPPIWGSSEPIVDEE